MATERQIEANRRNAARSKGPTSETGKSRSRANATKHGMAGASDLIEPGLSAEFAARRALWAAEFDPDGEAGRWALDRAVAASLRIERCEHALDEHVEATRQRARHAWDQDRAIEAAAIAGRLARDPVLASRQLEATWAGVGLLIGAWYALAEAIEVPGGWSEAERSKALDLLGVALDQRAGWTPIEATEGDDPIAFRRGLVLEEIDRLEALRDQSLAPLDEMDRRRAMAGDVALFSKAARLILRYERDAWRRYRESIRQVHEPAEEASPARSPGYEARRTIPIPVVEPPARPAPATPARSIKAERCAQLEEAARVLSGLTGQPLTIDLDGEDVDRRLDDLERWLDGLEAAPFAPIEAGIAARN